MNHTASIREVPQIWRRVSRFLGFLSSSWTESQIVSGPSVGQRLFSLRMPFDPQEAAMADTLVFQPAHGPDGLIVRLCGEIDMATVDPVREYRARTR